MKHNPYNTTPRSNPYIFLAWIFLAVGIYGVFFNKAHAADQVSVVYLVEQANWNLSGCKKMAQELANIPPDERAAYKKAKKWGFIDLENRLAMAQMMAATSEHIIGCTKREGRVYVQLDRRFPMNRDCTGFYESRPNHRFMVHRICTRRFPQYDSSEAEWNAAMGITEVK